MKPVRTISRHKHNFKVYPLETGGFTVRCKPVGVEAFNLLKTVRKGETTTVWGTVDEAVKGVSAYCKEHKIPFTAPTERDPSKAGNPETWRKAAESIAAAMKGTVWLEALDLTEMPRTAAALKKAYRKASLKAHPDHGGSDEAQRTVTEAYNYLKQLL